MEETASYIQEMKHPQNSEFFNGYGGFVEGGKEYEIILEGDDRPPSPWINVIANKDFGFHVSESGAGFTWASNSRENKLTPWSNDSVSDRACEAIYIKDEVSNRVITPTSLGKRDCGIYRVRHGFGYSVFLHEEDNLSQKLTVFSPLEEPLKLWALELTNLSEQVRYLTITYYVELVLGVDREQTNPYILTDYDNEHEYFHAKSIYNYDYRKNRAYLFSNEMIIGYTGDRREFFGPEGSVQKPKGILRKLSCNTGVSNDTCGAIQVSVAVSPGETKTVVFALGYGNNERLDQINDLRYKYKDCNKVWEELNKVKAYWNELLGTIQVETKDRAIDIMVNGWLLYQTLSCRINARAAFYQCGGAYGYRDQLQDALALLYTKPELLRNQIMIACSRQFEEGDVQHWWHPPIGIGVRTRISDDLLWLPFATAAYIKCTGDYTVLDEKVNYIKGPMLEANQHEIMFTPEISDLADSVYEHCIKAINHTEIGQHGLPLMGGGDWNDGMNAVGREGMGESVWLAWFLYTLLGDFIPLCKHKKEVEYAEVLTRKREKLIVNIEEHAWDGEWYLRAFYDDGTKLGSMENDECRIDSISQSWSVISGGAMLDRSEKALQSAWRYLVREKDGISLLLAPPFDKTNKNPGYIKNYFPGVRENGGQYTHAAVWLAIASTLLNNNNLAYTLFTMLNPIHTTSNKKDAIKYEKEPFVMTADISLNAPYSGRGGWSWYTGSAGWMYQGLVKWFLGLWLEKDELIIRPGVPVNFGAYSMRYLYGATTYEIHVDQSRGVSLVNGLEVDGVRQETNRIKLVDDGQKHIIYVI
jgi:cellobiose phosphorylase